MVRRANVRLPQPIVSQETPDNDFSSTFSIHFVSLHALPGGRLLRLDVMRRTDYSSDTSLVPSSRGRAWTLWSWLDAAFPTVCASLFQVPMLPPKKTDIDICDLSSREVKNSESRDVLAEEESPA